MSTRTEIKVLQYRRRVVVSEKQTGCQQLETKPYQTRKNIEKVFFLSLSPFIPFELGNALLKECCPADAFFFVLQPSDKDHIPHNMWVIDRFFSVPWKQITWFTDFLLFFLAVAMTVPDFVIHKNRKLCQGCVQERHNIVWDDVIATHFEIDTVH